MAEITPTLQRQGTAGDLTQYLVTFSAIGDADTWTSGLDERVVAHTATLTADPTTNSSAGINVAESNGVFTFYPGVNALSGTLIVWTTGN